MSLESATQQWCVEQQIEAGALWPLLKVFITLPEQSKLLAGQSLVRVLSQVIIAANELDVAQHKLNWWQSELQKHASSAHPALMALHESGCGKAWDWAASESWCFQLTQLLEPNVPLDMKALWTQAQLLVGNGWRIQALAYHSKDSDSVDEQTILDLGAALFILEQINQFVVQRASWRWIPLSLRARYQLQLDGDMPLSEQGNGLSLLIRDMLEPVLVVLQQTIVTMPESMQVTPDIIGWNRWLVLHQALGLKLAKRIQRHNKNIWEQPMKWVSPLSAWHCRQAVRRIKQ